jgi:hypothetical protein
MGVSPGESKSNAANATETAGGESAFFKTKILHRQVLRRGWFLIALLACAACWAGSAAAQEDRPEITPGERKVPRKKDAGPRAVGLLQMGANGKVSLVPIAILIGGKFWDATAYKADPVPMALDPGTVYEAERDGSSLGLFTINSALQSRAVNAQIPWIATGKWVPAGSEPAKTELKAETAPVGIDKSDEPPRLTRDPTRVSMPASKPASTTTPPASTPQTTGQSGSGDEPPRLTKGASTPESSPSLSPPAGSSGPATQGESKPSDSKPSDTKPGDTKPPDAKADNHANVPASDSGATEENRPRLRRGKPVEPLPEDDVPGYSKPGAASPAAPSAASSALATDLAKTAPAKADTAPVDLVPAISDATGPQPRSFGYEWLKDEEGERRAQMVALAKQKVRAYVEAVAKAKIAPAPTPSAGARHTASTKAAAKTKDPILENVKMTTFDVWTTNQPVIVFSAQAHMPPPPAGSPQVGSDSEMQYSVLLVAYPDTYNNLHTIYVGVTDKYHLDLTPRLELIDAVDADGDGRGELLFREVTDGGNGWVIYRPTADRLYKMFDSLHPE